ncbi:putative AbiEi antitoxin of type IV toxin-antitoxin system [Microbacterium sp. SLBN-154]|uniref:type IV toxin-antitoxin system AbiEi family antitoxin domain-containing protein n=1 Tax=Microbacterium sp. SLBN-154 TaxID=2768458 RepID=UPI00116C31E3|nr:type IV toxin-antitoxin system AbiEi family antitoxin domain-containing protein [Microbacterium sp. SLBN-154]TQK18961.1 putative AbiEi antitoxin of type IV toxin-antitoxin system [Microbacterium sp. SLBN-154]
MVDPHLTPSQVLSATFLSTRGLEKRGLHKRMIRRLVSEGRLIRLRRGRYADPRSHPHVLDAGRAGGRLDCVSLLATLGVFVRERPGLHIQFDRTASRIPVRRPEFTAHWRSGGELFDNLTTDLIGALTQAVKCQSPRDAIATLDSAWHLGLVDEDQIAEVFSRLPRRYRALRRLLDRRMESGPETLVRLILRGLGCEVDVQVHISGVGRVDFVVDGWLIIECDSKAHHEGWDAQRRDRRRDLAAAALGYTTIRPLAEDVLYAYDATATALRAVILTGRARNASLTPAHRRRRPENPGSGAKIDVSAGVGDAAPTRQRSKPSEMRSISSSRCSTGRNAPAAAFIWNASRSSSP